MGHFSRYLIKRFLSILLLALLCSVVIFVVIDFVENTKIWLNRPREDALLYYINYIPHIIYLILPIAILIASVFSVGLLSRHLEILIMRVSGASVFRILFPLVVVGVLISGGMFVFGDSVLPDANHARFKIKEPKTPENKTGNPNEKYKFVYRGGRDVTFLMQRYSGNKKVGRRGTLLIEKNSKLIKRFDFKRMIWENHWVLIDGIERNFEGDNIQSKSFKRKEMLNLQITPQDFINTRIFPDEMRMKTLEKRIQVLERGGDPTHRFKTQWHFKVAGCFVSLVMLLIGISISVNSVKSELAGRFGVALMLTFTYFILMRFGLTLGENGTVTPVMGAWLGNMVFGTLSVLMFLKVAFK